MSTRENCVTETLRLVILIPVKGTGPEGVPLGPRWQSFRGYGPFSNMDFTRDITAFYKGPVGEK